jgi:hypothetical protein
MTDLLTLTDAEAEEVTGYAGATLHQYAHHRVGNFPEPAYKAGMVRLYHRADLRTWAATYKLTRKPSGRRTARTV